MGASVGAAFLLSPMHDAPLPFRTFMALPMLVLVISAVVAARRRAGRRRVVWVILAISAVFEGAGVVVDRWAGNPVDSWGTVPGEFLYVLGLAALAVAAVVLTSPTIGDVAITTLNGLILAGAVFAVMWSHALMDRLFADDLPLSRGAIHLVAVILNGVLIAVSMALVYQRLARHSVGRPAPLPMLFVVGLLLTVARDCFLAFAPRPNAYPVEVLTQLKSVFLALSPWVALTYPRSTAAAVKRDPYVDYGRIPRYWTTLVTAVGVLALSPLFLIGPRVDRVGRAAVTGIGILILGQAVTVNHMNRRMSNRLEESRRAYQMLAIGAHDLLLRVRHDGRVVEVVDGGKGEFARWLIGNGSLLGRRWESVVLAEDVGQASVWAADTDNQSLRVRLIGADDSTRWVEVIRTLTTEPMIGVRDVDAEVRRIADLERDSLTDQVSGLWNRLAMDRALSRAVKAVAGGDGTLYLLYADLDGFKQVNDTAGHAAGDRVLRSVGRRLRSTVADRGRVFRVGGDEFVVLVDTAELDVYELTGLAEDLVRCIREPIDGIDSPLTACVGIAEWVEGMSEAELIAEADLAMYRAKSRHPGAVAFFDPEMLAGDYMLPARRSSNPVDLATLSLRFQPIVDLHTGTVEGFEALASAKDVAGRNVDAATLIEAAEAGGTIGDIGQRILRLALAQARRWADMGFRIPVSVNVSARQLTSNRVVDQIMAELEAAQVQPVQLVVELTETTLVTAATPAEQTIEMLRAAGVRVVIDDFGTGFNGLTYLRRLDVDGLKVDRSFLAGIGEGGRPEHVLDGIIELGRDLGKRVVIEGIEAAEQARLLRGKGAVNGQGYWLSPPLPADQAAEFLRVAAGNRAIARL